jgi:precorrin isomerase
MRQLESACPRPTIGVPVGLVDAAASEHARCATGAVPGIIAPGWKGKSRVAPAIVDPLLAWVTSAHATSELGHG